MSKCYSKCDFGAALFEIRIAEFPDASWVEWESPCASGSGRAIQRLRTRFENRSGNCVGMC